MNAVMKSGDAGGKFEADRLFVVAFFLMYLLIGIAIHDHYGGSWDENINRDLGTATFNYIKSRASNPIPWPVASQGLIAEQGPIFETVLILIQQTLNLKDSSEILLMRHLVNFITFWLGSIAFYLLLRQQFPNRMLCLVGVSLLVMAPRLFSHSFYNSKDAILTVLFIFATLTLIKFVGSPSILNAIFHAFTCAAAIDLRLVALLVPVLTLFLIILRYKDSTADKRYACCISTALYVGLLAILIVLFWPALWEDPIGRLVAALGKMAASNQIHNNFSLYLGEFVRVDKLPWHYLPLWISITLPIPYLLFFLVGAWTVGVKFVDGSLPHEAKTFYIAMVVLLVIPLLAVLVKRPVLYDDWRHFYFLHPFIVAFALTGVAETSSKPGCRKGVMVAVVLMLVHSAGILVSYHPYQNVYFNSLAGKDIVHRFELDYWGVSFKEGLRYVLDRTSGKVKVHVSDNPGSVNYDLLDPASRERIELVELEEASYFISNHRQPKHYADFCEGRYPCVNPVYRVSVAGATLLSVYKIR